MKSSLFDIILEFKNKNINKELKNTDFLQIQKPIQSSDYSELGKISYEWLQKGYFDLRLVIYFLYSNLLENNNLIYIFSVISKLLEEYSDILFPLNYKEKHFSQAIIWFHKRLIVFIEDNDLNEPDNIEEVQSVISDYKKNIKEFCKISYCENFNLIENKISLLLKDVISKEEVKEISNEETKILNGFKNNNNINTRQKSFYSQKLDKLLNKINIFKKLLSQENYQRAASIEYIIDQELEKYRIDHYFEDLFVEYFCNKLNYADNLRNYQEFFLETSGNRDIKILERLLNSNEYLTQELSEV